MCVAIKDVLLVSKPELWTQCMLTVVPWLLLPCLV